MKQIDRKQLYIIADISNREVTYMSINWIWGGFRPSPPRKISELWPDPSPITRYKLERISKGFIVLWYSKVRDLWVWSEGFEKRGARGERYDRRSTQ